jgi:hypothetical protein
MTATSAGALRELPFAHATGRDLKIAVIDSGVNIAHPHIVADTHAVALRFAGQENDATPDDQLGHGTAVTAAIQEKAPGAQYHVLKLFTNSLRTTTPRLIEAMEWAIDRDMDLINLSLGTPNLEYRDAIQSLVNRANARGILLIAARNDGSSAVLPGMLDGVIGVDLDWSLPRDRYRVEEENGTVRFLAPGFPRPLPGRPPVRNLYGISFAVANMTGFVARACDGLGRVPIDKVRQLLADEEGFMEENS